MVLKTYYIGSVANCHRTQNGVQIQARGRLFKAVLYSADPGLKFKPCTASETNQIQIQTKISDKILL